MNRPLSTLRIHLRALLDRRRIDGQRRRLAAHLGRGRPAVLDLHVPGMGLFAHLSWVLLGLDWAAQHGHRLHFRCTNAHYNRPGRADDWLRLVVDQAAPAEGREFRIRDYGEFPFARSPLGQGRARVRALLRRTLRPNPGIVADCERWLADRAGAGPVLGVHYRGTDKHTEAPRLPYADALDSIGRLVAGLGAATGQPVSVFLATDEASFLDAARGTLRGARILARDQVLRSAGATALHATGANDGPRLAREAMADALLLSRCDLLAKTASALSGWAALLGQEMPVLFLSRPETATAFYPDGMLAPESYLRGQEDAAIAAALANQVSTA